MICGNITLGASVDCADLILGGTRSTAYLINWDDVDYYTVTNGRITEFVLKEDKNAYAFSGNSNHVKVSQETEQTRRKRNFKHNIGITIYERTQAQKINMARMCKGLFVALVHLKGDDDDAIVVVGIESGLILNPANVMDAFANGGNYVLSFSTDQGQFEKMPIASLGTDYENALDIISGLLPSEFGIELEDDFFLIELEDNTDIIILQ